MMAVDPFGGLNFPLPIILGLKEIQKLIFLIESLSDMNHARYGAGYTTNEYIYLWWC